MAKLDPAVLDAYVGRYQADVPGKGKQLFELSRDGSRLFCQPKGRPSTCSRPSPRHLFYIKAVDSEARFVQGSAMAR